MSVELQDTDQCVMCGLCLPHCPTYQLSRDEGESPRGRLALIKALGNGDIEPDNQRLAYHLDRCLGCRACEAMCPSKVPFFALMDAARARLYEARGPERYGLKARMALKVSSSAMTTRLAGTVAGFAGINNPLKSGSLTAHGPSAAGQVILFTGCTSSLIDHDLARDAKALLVGLGYEVIESEAGACCGALNRHAGNRPVADSQWNKNLAFAQRFPEMPLLSIATGCSAEFAGYPDAVASRHQELTHFLAGSKALDGLEWNTDAMKVAIHVPCTQRNVLGETDTTRALLSRLPGLEIHDLPLAHGCCGAGGLNQLEQKDIAEALRAPVLEWILQEQPDVIVSPNAGCSLHLLDGIKKQGVSCRVVHPIQLLASRIKPA